MRGMGQGSSAAMILIGALVSAPPNFSGAFVPACPAGHPLGFKIAAPCTMHWRARRGGGAAKVPSSSWHMKTRGDGYGTRMSPDAVGRGDDDTSECTGGIAEENSLSRRQAGYAQHTPGVSSGGSLLPVGGDGDEKAADDMAGRSHAKGRRSFLVLSAGLAGVSVGRAMEAHAVSRSFRSKDFDLQNPVDPEAMQSGEPPSMAAEATDHRSMCYSRPSGHAVWWDPVSATMICAPSKQRSPQRCLASAHHH